MTMREKMNIKGKVKLTTRDAKTGEIIETRENNNLVVTAGRQETADLWRGAAATAFGYTAVGTDNTAPVVGDTTLGTELIRKAWTSDTRSGTTVTTSTTYGTTEANGTLYEAGQFNAAAAGDMFNRVTFAALTKNNTMTLTVDFEITF